MSENLFEDAHRRASIALEMLEKITPGPWQPWAGRGWPLGLVKAFELDVPEEECGVWWPIAPGGTGRGTDADWLIFCRESRDQDFVSLAPELVKTLAELLISVIEEARISSVESSSQ